MVRAAFIAIVLAILAAPVVAWQGSRSGNWQGGWTSNPTSGASVTIDAMPYARTVTCSTYTLTGTSTGGAAVTWAASPSGASGACTGTSSFSCPIDVDPDATGEGVEVITVTSGTATDTETIGFYVDGEHSCFLSQNVNGTYNSGLTNADAVATWTNLGSSAKNVTQGTGSAQPTFRTSVVGGQPVVRCDGGDELRAATASDWTYLSNGTDFTVEDIFAVSAANPANYQTRITTEANCGNVDIGFCLYYDDRTTDDDRSGALIKSGASTIVSLESGNDATPAQVFSLVQLALDDDGGAGVDLSQFCNGSSCGTSARSGSYSASAPAFPLTLCAEPSSTADFTGDLFRVLIYQSALTSTQRGINKAVDEWALGGTLPVTP